jgi:hypothetical protein
MWPFNLADGANCEGYLGKVLQFNYINVVNSKSNNLDKR